MARLARQKRRSAEARAASRQLNTDLISLVRIIIIMSLDPLKIGHKKAKSKCFFFFSPHLLKRTARAVVFPSAPAIPT